MKRPLNTHDFTATFQEGVVSQVDPKTHRIKATLPALEDLETAWLPFATLNAGGNQFYALPDVGELVAMVLDARGEHGYVLGTIYNEVDPVPVANSEIWLHKFSNGTEISHNRSTGDVVVKTTGKVKVTAAVVEITAPCQIVGDVTVQGNISATGTISAPTVSSQGVVLATHKHSGVSSGPSNTGLPL